MSESPLILEDKERLLGLATSEPLSLRRQVAVCHTRWWEYSLALGTSEMFLYRRVICADEPGIYYIGQRICFHHRVLGTLCNPDPFSAPRPTTQEPLCQREV